MFPGFPELEQPGEMAPAGWLPLPFVGEGGGFRRIVGRADQALQQFAQFRREPAIAILLGDIQQGLRQAAQSLGIGGLQPEQHQQLEKAVERRQRGVQVRGSDFLKLALLDLHHLPQMPIEAGVGITRALVEHRRHHVQGLAQAGGRVTGQQRQDEKHPGQMIEENLALAGPFAEQLQRGFVMLDGLFVVAVQKRQPAAQGFAVIGLLRTQILPRFRRIAAQQRLFRQVIAQRIGATVRGQQTLRQGDEFIRRLEMPRRRRKNGGQRLAQQVVRQRAQVVGVEGVVEDQQPRRILRQIGGVVFDAGFENTMHSRRVAPVKSDAQPGQRLPIAAEIRIAPASAPDHLLHGFGHALEPTFPHRPARDVLDDQAMTKPLVIGLNHQFAFHEPIQQGHQPRLRKALAFDLRRIAAARAISERGFPHFLVDHRQQLDDCLFERGQRFVGIQQGLAQLTVVGSGHGA